MSQPPAINTAFQPLSSFLASFDRSALPANVKQAAADRESLLREFPLALWPQMPLEKYALGHDGSEGAFCRHMEFRTQALGSIQGGSAAKHIVYKHKQKAGWHFPPGYGSEVEAWEAVRAGFLKAFELAQEGRWDEVDGVQAIQPGPALRGKTMHVYFPDEILPIYSETHLRSFLERLEEAPSRKLGVIQLNRALRTRLARMPKLEGWSTTEIGLMLYRWHDPRDTKRIFKIAPGEDARLWDDCLKNGYIRVGWEEIGDLEQFESKQAFMERFRQTFYDLHSGHAPTLTKKANELWTLKELEPGDIVVANRGISQVLAIGEVVEPGYEWRAELSEYNHVVRVKWDTSHARKIQPQNRWGLVTIAAIPPALFSEIFASNSVLPPVAVDPIFTTLKTGLEHKGQVVLYGPPGTGKTYTARRFALWWLARSDERVARALADDSLIAGTEAVLASGQITRITFHPSYSYEDFVEGFRPVQTDGSQLLLRLEDGVFKKVCLDAQAHPDRKFLILIDELNRGNVAKIFGELITVLEKDKRGMVITLPQSKEAFVIPPNVFVLATMNTADRSLKHLDAALRRRFQFIEVLPDSSLLQGAQVRNLPLDDFLDGLNATIVRFEGREKQIGHSFLMEGGQPITGIEEFSHRFRYEMLPLLQDYCYDNFNQLAEYIGTDLVDTARQCFDEERLSDPDLLLDALEQKFVRAAGHEGR